MLVKVNFPDSSMKAVEVLSCTTGKDFVEAICKRLDLTHPEEYAIYLTSQGKGLIFFFSFFFFSFLWLDFFNEK